MTGLATPPDTPPSDDDSSHDDRFNDTPEEYDDIPQLADLTTLPDESYSAVTMVANSDGAYGLSLRHFTIQSGQQVGPYITTRCHDNMCVPI